MKIRYILKKARKEKKLTQANVASYLGITTNGYQAIELGTRGTSEDNWLKLFNLFDCKVPLNQLMENSKAELLSPASKNSSVHKHKKCTTKRGSK